MQQTSTCGAGYGKDDIPVAAVSSEGGGLPEQGFVRLKQILAPRGPIPVSRSTWWAGVSSGRFPKPTKFFGSGITAWDVADIRRLIAQAEAEVMND